MKKTAMIAAMWCALACPSLVDARQCDASEPWYAFGTSKRGADGKRVEPLYVAGRLPMTLGQLQKEGKMDFMGLEIMEEDGGFLRARPFQVSTAPYGALCLEFLDLNVNQMDHMLNKIAGPENEMPAVCISAEGRVTASLQSTGPQPFKYIRLKAGSEVLLEAVQSGCNTICPVGQSTLLNQSLTTKRDGSSTEGVVALVGRAPMGLEQLQKTYNLKTSILEVGNRATPYAGSPPRRFQFERLRERSDGALCMVFEAYSSSSESDVASFADAKEAGPNICISKGGQIDGKFSIKLRELLHAAEIPDPYVRIQVRTTAEDEFAFLFDTDKASCKL